ncbi:MAG: c-type cytochrome [Lewinellaceae bacterium]|nr:c-type cytochrome [Saprospiraceae bacterium]MCB9336730.1 c-type cytochrome [Lewinellaceae bacterium]
MPDKVFFLLPVFLLLLGCQKDDQPKPDELEGLMAGGGTTVFSTGPDAYTFPLANIGGYLGQHAAGDAAFEQAFVTAPAPQFGGIGPVFNQNACIACHVRNGRSAPPVHTGDPATGLLLRLSIPGEGAQGGALPVPGFGVQLQTKAIFGEMPEGTLAVAYKQEVVEFLTGEKASLQLPVFAIENPYQPLPVGVLTSPRNAPPVFGLGLLEAIPEAGILALADENDSNGDGISGRPNWVWDIKEQRTVLGRFGWKAGNPTAVQQTADAFNHDMGITNSYFPMENCQGQGNCQSGLSPGLDIDDDFVETTAFYFKTLGVPGPRGLDDEVVKIGRELFDAAKCSSCHVPKHQTGSDAISALSFQTIYPYTDLLLHDMGEGLADGRPDFSASGQEWRTPPLWGIGLAQVVNPKASFLHDGRARTLEEAILWHGGEAEASRNFYKNASKKEREAMVAFLKAL